MQKIGSSPLFSLRPYQKSGITQKIQPNEGKLFAYELFKTYLERIKSLVMPGGFSTGMATPTDPSLNSVGDTAKQHACYRNFS